MARAAFGMHSPSNRGRAREAADVAARRALCRQRRRRARLRQRSAPGGRGDVCVPQWVRRRFSNPGRMRVEKMGTFITAAHHSFHDKLSCFLENNFGQKINFVGIGPI